MHRILKRYVNDRSGNYMMLTALMLPVLMIPVGGAVDYSGLLRSKSLAQNAADIAVLAGTKEAGKLRDKKQTAAAIFANNIGEAAEVAKSDFKPVGNGSYEYTATVKYDPSFLGLFGINELTADVRSVAQDSRSNLDIVFVLDSSGSMGSSDGSTTRMAELKKAVKLFLGSFETGGSVKGALVPFDTQVRVDNAVMTSDSGSLATVQNPYASSTNCSSISDPIDRKACEDNKTVHYADCSKLKTRGVVDEEVDAYHCARKREGFRFDSTAAYIEDGNPRDSYQFIATTDGDRHRIWRNIGDECASYNSTTFECFGFTADNDDGYVYDEPAPAPTGPQPSTSKTNSTMTANNDLLRQPSQGWSGCVIDRTQNYDVRADAPMSGNPQTLYPQAHCARPSLLAIKALTNDLDGLSTYVDGLQANGNTNLTIGVQWGMEALTGTSPLQGARSSAGTRKIMILLTDGENTQNRWWGWKRKNDIDTRARLACDNAKGLGAEIFSVRLIGGNESLLRHCAKDSSQYYSVTSANELSDVFSEIASNLRRIRLTH